MTTKTLTGAYPSGYTLKATYDRLIVENTATVGGTGVFVTAAAYVSNFANITANKNTSDGIYLNFGGKINNQVGTISGYDGIKSSAGVPTLGTVFNYGVVTGKHNGVELLEGGAVLNAGTISGGHNAVDVTGGAGAVSNFGTITYAGYANTGRVGVYLAAGGLLLNGNLFNTKVLIQSDTGVVLTGGSASNYGTIKGVATAVGYDGVRLAGGAGLTNGAVTDRGALIEGYTGVATQSSLSNIANFGTIASIAFFNHPGVYLDGGTLTNGSGFDTTALVQGYSGVTVASAGTVTNFGTIAGNGPTTGAYGVLFASGGRLTNGSAASHGALIEGYAGVEVKTSGGSVANFGTIVALGVTGQVGAMLLGGGVVTNGSTADKYAVIKGVNGVKFGLGGSLINYGTVNGATGTAVNFAAGGSLINGAATAQSALIEGLYGVKGATTVTNFGTIQSTAGNFAAVYSALGGKVTNGGGSDRSALIEGAVGIETAGAIGAIKNFGTVRAMGGAGDYGVRLHAGGTVANGSVNNATAVIEGYGGVRLEGAASAVNFGTIWGQGDAAGVGARVGAGASLTNGSAGHAGAIIEGYSGVSVDAGAAGTVTNFGTIVGQGGAAVQFASPTDVLVVEAGSAFIGAVNGAGGTLDLASGVGTLTGLLASGIVTVSGSMAATTFHSFNTIEVGAGATFTDTGAVTIAAGQTVNAAGTLTLGGSGAASIVNAGLIETTGTGTLTLKGAVSGTGTAKIGGGTLFSASSFNEAVTFTGTTGVLELAKSQTYTAAIRGFSKTGGTSLDLNDIAFGGSTKATFSGTAISGTLTVTDGTHTAHLLLIGDYRTSTFVAASDGHGGTTIHDPTKTTTPPWINPSSGRRFVAAMAGLGASGADGAIHVGETWSAREPLLVQPRAMMA